MTTQRWELHERNCLEVLQHLPEASIDALVSDPPYGLGEAPDMVEVLSAWLAGEPYQPRGAGFMGKAWDAFVPGPEIWRETFRVLKPGGHAAVFAGTRTYDLMGVALRLAGFLPRDSVALAGWCFGSGFPKSLNLGDGRGTALKPAWEPILLLRKPLDGTVAGNVAMHGTGAMNIDACRVAPTGERLGGGAETGSALDVAGWDRPWMHEDEARAQHAAKAQKNVDHASAAGRWPPNLLLSHGPACGDACEPGCPVAELDAQSGVRTSGKMAAGTARRSIRGWSGPMPARTGAETYGDSGPASRFFPVFRYVPKASRSEREQGCEKLPARTGAEAVDREEGSAGLQNPRAGAGRTAGQVRNFHPTVKPLALMAWLCRLVTPPGGVVLDPFAGSGSTGIAALLEGFRFVGIEREPDYAQIARARLAWAEAEAEARRPKQLRLLEGP